MFFFKENAKLGSLERKKVYLTRVVDGQINMIKICYMKFSNKFNMFLIFSKNVKNHFLKNEA